MDYFNELKEKLNKKFVKKVLIQLISLIYIFTITFVVTRYSSNIILPDLFDNERVTVNGLMLVSMLFIGMVLFVKEKNIIKFMCVYHLVLIFTVLSVIVPYDLRPLALLPMILSLIYDNGIGIAGALALCAYNVFTLSERPDFIVNGPEFLLIIVMLIITGTAAIIVNKKSKIYMEIPLYVLLYGLSIGLHKIFGSYCEDFPGCEVYAESSFKFFASKGVIISVVVFFVIKRIYMLFTDNVRLQKKLEEISMEDYLLVEEMKKNSKNLYKHSVKVAELSGKAAKAIGANEDLCFAGGLLHDVGKMAGSNYVNEGIKIANKYNLPSQIKNIIIEHNVKNRLPKSKESAIVMLADTAISAVEYLRINNKTDVDEDKVFENALMTRLKNGALNDSTLTISEFNSIKEAFLQHKI